jgi:nucleolar protein 4
VTNEHKSSTLTDKGYCPFLSAVVMAGSRAAAGVSMADMEKRLQLEQWKSQMLRNLNMFVSRFRLVIHNLPPSWNDSKLRQLFLQHAGPKAVIKEVSIFHFQQKYAYWNFIFASVQHLMQNLLLKGKPDCQSLML